MEQLLSPAFEAIDQPEFQEWRRKTIRVVREVLITGEKDVEEARVVVVRMEREREREEREKVEREEREEARGRMVVFGAGR